MHFGCTPCFNPISLPLDPWTACLPPGFSHLRGHRTGALGSSLSARGANVSPPKCINYTRTHTLAHAWSRISSSEAALPAPLLPSASSAQRASDHHGGAGERGAERPAVGPQAERAVRARGNRGSHVSHGEDLAGPGRSGLKGGGVVIRGTAGKTGTWDGSFGEEASPE